MSFLGFFDGSPKSAPDPNEVVLAQLYKAGSDFSKPHKIEFFLYFPTQSAAEAAASHIREAGFEVEVSMAAEGDDWLCFATKRLIPDLSVLQKISSDFTNLAGSLGGEYDGWGTKVEK